MDNRWFKNSRLARGPRASELGYVVLGQRAVMCNLKLSCMNLYGNSSRPQGKLVDQADLGELKP